MFAILLSFQEQVAYMHGFVYQGLFMRSILMYACFERLKHTCGCQGPRRVCMTRPFWDGGKNMFVLIILVCAVSRSWSVYNMTG